METSQTVNGRWIENPLVRWSFLLFLGAIIATSIISRMVHLPTNAPGHYVRGLTDIEEGRYKEAVENLTLAITMNPGNSEYFISRGYAKNRMGDTTGALSDYEQALKMAPFDAKAYTGRGYTKQRRNDPNGAIEDYTKAITLDPRNTDAYQGRASVLERLGDEEAALGDYTIAVQLAPTSGTCYLKRADLHYDQGRWQEARYGYDRATELLSDREAQSRARLMAWLARSWMGDRSGSAADLGGGPKTAKVDGPDAAFLNRVLFLTGQISDDALIATAGSGGSADSAERRCEAFFLTGTEKMIAKERPRALALLWKALAEKTRDFYAADRSRAEVRNALLGLRAKATEPGVSESPDRVALSGMVVSAVRDGGPAARAGLLVGDVIVKIEGESATPAALLALEEKGELGKTLTLELRRAGRDLPLRLTLGD